MLKLFPNQGEWRPKERKMKKWILAMAMLALSATLARADWKTVAEIAATDKSEAR